MKEKVLSRVMEDLENYSEPRKLAIKYYLEHGLEGKPYHLICWLSQEICLDDWGSREQLGLVSSFIRAYRQILSGEIRLSLNLAVEDEQSELFKIPEGEEL